MSQKSVYINSMPRQVTKAYAKQSYVKHPIGIGGGNGDVNGDGDGPGMGVERTKEGTMGTRTGEGTGRERGWRPVDELRMETGLGAGTETRAVAETGTGTGMGTRTGSRRAEKRRRSARNPHKSCRRHVGNGKDLSGKRKKRRQKGLVQ